jgi:citrate synthase
MRIGKQDRPVTAISTSDAESITVRGQDLCGDLIGRIDFTSYFWLLVTGERPSDTQRFFADAVLTAIAEHGLVPSVAAARMTYAAAPEAFQGAVAAGLLGGGSAVFGSSEVCGRFLVACLADGGGAEAAERGIRALRVEKKAIPGLGHPEHTGGDPRARVLLALAEEHNVAGRHVEMLYAVRDAVPGVIGKTLPINVNGAIPAVMLDVGFPLAGLKGIALLARTASLVAHLTEEAETPIGFILAGKAAEAIRYEGA